MMSALVSMLSLPCRISRMWFGRYCEFRRQHRLPFVLPQALQPFLSRIRSEVEMGK